MRFVTIIFCLCCTLFYYYYTNTQFFVRFVTSHTLGARSSESIDRKDFSQKRTGYSYKWWRRRFSIDGLNETCKNTSACYLRIGMGQ